MERLTQKDVQHADAAAMTLLSHTLELSGQGMIVLTKNGRVLLLYIYISLSCWAWSSTGSASLPRSRNSLLVPSCSVRG